MNYEDPWTDLANAVVVCAAKDYRRWRKRLKKDPDDGLAVAKLKSLEKFFKSSWCDFLSRMDGTYILKKLEEEE